MHAPVALARAACIGAAHVLPQPVLISFHVWRNLSPAA
ncbi:hypothetical protein X992_5620 [Burkholderia pseudomallei MSHR5492]|nr:hypothetical protein X989_4847 [Burkholderia pseudomallei MSHR4378]KGS22107.1 hypothetical protein X941_5487 [Burkholderia pseudomallei MSHR5569]KGS37862.1 hypothetical protein X945_5121 [Burkholderia pseudomallei ABCPW 107]KGS37891.1 hypothetical protein X992_5620 [Burkholderia pseudomallei MSHR5492]